ncbi:MULTISPECIES: DUF3347 domain-containing protein [Christiangramia]|uniref:DUF3347 domain-containing protein n=1 Tax=Christiangramia forsetii (strain DSM 17595 / CGMCC 1.15422 / KT0803) TaxID=411154 RepID=A0M122_CHRFK|nr:MULTISPECIES: DUF3347 domain-containing protein [Christiangramia]CAL66317.1 conserved hypothetical protein [Christiangramia forsetii KT0803]
MNFQKWILVVILLILSRSVYPCDIQGHELNYGYIQTKGLSGPFSPTGKALSVLPAFLGSYIEIKNALIEDHYVQAKNAAAGMEKNLENSNLKEKEQVQLRATIKELILAGDINDQRIAFAVLSEQLYQILPAIDFGSEALFWQNCPMALGGRGGNWISLEEQVKNPFMGQRMPSCGTALEKLMR